MKILVLNCGSSSLKYQLINMETEEVLASGKYERIGEAEAFITHKVNGRKIEIKKPESILGKDTITSMQAGIVYGYIGQTEYIIDNMKKESGLLNAKVIATGGLGRIIYENTDRIDIYDKELTLQGMRLIYEKNKK